MKLTRSLAVSGLLTVAFAGQALAHIVMLDPKPRDNKDDHKNDAAPCIARTATQSVAKLTAGGTLTVKFGETVNHPGCFLVDFAETDTGMWTTLGTIAHSNMGGASPARPRMYTTDVKLPDKPCDKCVLRVRQIMLRADPPTCPPATIPPGDTYYSCANIELAAGGAVDGGAAPVDAGGSGGSMGMSGSGGSVGTGGSPSGAGGVTGTGGASTTGGSSGSATGGSGAGGSASGGGGGATASGGSSGSGTGGSSSAGSSSDGGTTPGCAVAAAPGSAGGLAVFGLFGLAGLMAGLRRRRR